MMIDSQNIFLGNRLINKLSKPYVIAEIGVNHEGSLSTAKMLIELAKEGGADAAKFQSYKADTLASINSPAYWDTKKEPTESQHQLFQKYDKFNAHDYMLLAEYCKNLGIDFLSTPFDDDSIEYLNPLMPFFKIASADLTNLPFLRKIAQKKKPIVLSTGASTLGEIDFAVNNLERFGCENLILLHCVLNYPTSDENAHLGMIKGLIRAYPSLLIGYSDHTQPDQDMTALVTAYLSGAVVIEKHFTHDKSLPGNDHYHAMDIKDLKNFTNKIDKISTLIGRDEFKSPIPTEEISRKNARRSIVIKRGLQKNHILVEDDITYKRPGTGISPEHWDEVIGRCTSKTLSADHVLQWSDLS
jgi:N-acetylneuraminate synthase